jgi:hypothetical protein
LRRTRECPGTEGVSVPGNVDEGQV